MQIRKNVLMRQKHDFSVTTQASVFKLYTQANFETDVPARRELQ